MIKITVPGTPVGKGRPRAVKRGAHIGMYTPEKTASYENLIKTCAAEAMGDAPPLAGAVSLELFLFITPPASWSLKKQRMALAGDLHPTSKPDADNVLKAVADACNGIVWNDDKQITDVIVRKRYAPRACAHMLVSQVLF